MNRWVLFVTALLAVAACTQGTPEPQNILDSPRDAPTALPPAWREPAAPITLENVPNIALLGRLDSAGSPSTIFDHALSPDGTLLAGLDNEQLAVWDLISGQRVFSTGRRDEVTRVFFSSDKTEVYAVEMSSLVTVHSASDGRAGTTFRGIDQYDGILAYEPENGWLAFGNRKGEARIWDPLAREALATIQAHNRPVQRLAFSNSGDLLAAADSFGAVSIWNWRSRELIARIEDDAPALTMQFTPDDSLLAVGTRSDIRLWSAADGTLARRLATGPEAVETLVAAPDSRYLVNTGSIPDAQLWDLQAGSLVARLPGVGEDRVAAAFAPDSTLLLTADLGGGVNLWNLTTITENTVNNASLDTQGVLIYDVEWTSDSLLLMLFGATGSVYLWGIPPASS